MITTVGGAGKRQTGKSDCGERHAQKEVWRQTSIKGLNRRNRGTKGAMSKLLKNTISKKLSVGWIGVPVWLMSITALVIIVAAG